MIEANKPNLAQDLQRIHMIITRGLDVSIEQASQFAREGFRDRDLREGYRKYVTALLSFVSAHHLTEDEVAFPYFEDRLPEMPFALYNLPADERAALTRNMPPKVIEELMPGPWRERWAPMQPFLLA